MGLFLFSSCKEDVFPKPSSYLRLDYPIAKYADFENECPFTFEMNSEAVIKGERIVGLITYPKMKATIYLTYKPVNNNINVLLRDSKLTYEHVIKADDILEQPYLNPKKSIRYVLSGGNHATNSQFYATDSTKHFVTGSVYFMQSPILTLLCLRPVILK
jgi:gliding motility-associated lipoprotein GldD